MTRPYLTIFSLLIFFALLSTACDPLGSEAVAAVPTPIASATNTASPAPPTATDAPLLPTGTPFPSSTPGECSDPHGQIVSDAFSSKVTHASVAYRIYLPPCYWQSNRRYPYVMLFHGSDSDQTQWTDALKVDKVLDQGIAAGTLPPMIVVMPTGGDLANTNIFRDGMSFEWLVINELMPLVEKTFCTWNTREGRAIGGISRGGFWAYEIALRHPELFGAVGGHSAFFDKDAMPPLYNPLNLATTIKFAPGLQPRFWLDAGQDDYARPALEAFAKELSDRGINPGYTLYPIGQHESAYWAQHVTEYMAFYGQTWPRSSSELPSCLQ